VVGPISNFLIAGVSVLILAVVAFTSAAGETVVQNIPPAYQRHLDELAAQSNPVLLPLTLLAYEFMVINLVLGVFNLIPVPPLDGSHVLRHFLPDSIRRAYDTVGWVGLLVLVYFGGGLLGRLIYPVLNFFDSILMRF
jgi:Zn-dependent protease